jgi:branched-chain amino acid transport system ATP-binding protein
MTAVALHAERLERHFGGVAAVQDVTFTLQSGKVLAVIGPNGAGKTTLFNLVTGFLPLHGGSLRMGSNHLEGLRPSQIAAKGIARTFQNLQTFRHMSVLENVLVGMHTRISTGLLRAMLGWPSARREDRDARQTAIHYLETVGLEKLAAQRAGTLSFGQQRLLEIVRAIAARPAMLLLDEPAAGLSGEETIRLSNLIREIRETGIGILLVEHNIGMVFDLADDILVMDYGRKIAQGPPEQIERDPMVIAAYLGAETD